MRAIAATAAYISQGVKTMPALGSVHKSRILLGDVSHESSAVEVYNGAVTAVSIGGFLTNLTALQNAIAGLTIGTIRQQSWIGDLTTVSNAWPTDPAAHRENKLLIDYQDDVTQEPFTLTIPTIDFTKLVFVPMGGDAVFYEGALASAELVAFVTAFEDIGRSPRNDQNTVTVIGARYVGRNT